MKNDTIYALATPLGGALCLVRLSGSEAIAAADRLFSRSLAKAPTRQALFGRLTDTADGSVLDEAVLTVYRAPHSFTGEDAVEISCHASPYIASRLMALLQEGGARQANAGEFTQRAFLNGKLDLSQAEAVADIIAAQSKAQHDLAVSQLRGDFSQELRSLREALLHLNSMLELELDFSDHEDLQFADRAELLRLLTDAEGRMQRLCDSFRLGNAVRRGVPCAIVGKTNVGKSTLLNALLGEERAIVSDVHGTTRDTVEEMLNIGGTLFRLIDTAGLRQTSDTVENMGIERTLQQTERAQVVVLLLDARAPQSDLAELLPLLPPLEPDAHLVLALNKADLLPSPIDDAALAALSQSAAAQTGRHATAIALSAKQKSGIDELKQEITCHLSPITCHLSAEPVLTNARHYEALSRALEAARRAKDGMNSRLSGDLIAQDIRQILAALADILGEITPQETLSNIFSHFCIGK